MTTRRWILLALVIVSLGMSAPFIRAMEAPALSVVFWRVALAWPPLAAIALWRREPWPRAGLAAGVFLSMHWVAWVLSVQSTSVAAAATLVNTGSLWAALLSKPLLRESVPPRLWGGLALAFVGVVLIVTSAPAGRHALKGDLWALASAIAWVGYAFVGRRTRVGASFWGYAATVYGTAGVLIVGMVLVSGAPLAGFSPTTWAALAGLALFPTLIGHGGVNYLLGYVPAARLSLWALGEVVLAPLIAWPIFGEVPSLSVGLGAAVTVVGVALGSYAGGETGAGAAAGAAA